MVQFMSISDRLLKARKALNLTQADFAFPLGIDRGYVSTLEHGSREPSVTLIKLIKHEHGISDTWLKTGEGEMFISPEEVLKSQKARFGERAFMEAVNNIMKENGLAMAAGRPAHRPAASDPDLDRMLNTLYDLWTTSDDDMKGWIKVQYRHAFPAEVVEEAQKKQQDTNRQASAG